MQSQESSQDWQEQSQAHEYVVNADPREQRAQPETPPYEERSYEDGYSGQYESDNWFREAEKLRPSRSPQQLSGIYVVALVLAALCVGVLLGTFMGVLISWLSWALLGAVILIGAVVIISNWRTVQSPLPVQTFQVQEYARLIINNNAGAISIRRGEQHSIQISPTARVSGPWVTSTGNVYINAEQQSDTVRASSVIKRAPFLSFSRIDLEITVPQDCDVQVTNGSGKINVQEVRGEMKIRTGSGSIEAHTLEGQITLATGSGRVNLINLAGRADIVTGSGSVHAQQLRGETRLKTGSGSVYLEEVSGRMQLKTGSGRVQVLHSNLTRDANFVTGSGSVEFSGTLDPFGTYRFKTGSGHIECTLDEQTAFSLKAKTGSGGVHNEFGGNEVGNGPRARLELRTGSGAIRIRRGY